MGGIATRDWRAWEHSYPSRKDARTLIVTGLAQIGPGKKVVLEEHEHLQSEQAKILYLKFDFMFSTEPEDSLEPVWFQKKIKPGDYTNVQLLNPQGHPLSLLDVD